MNRHWLVAALILSAVCAAGAEETKWPKEGFVPNAETAMKIAEAIWIPIYGDRVVNQKPYQVKLDGKNWIVQGTLQPNMVGGTAVAVIAKQDGRVLQVFHSK